MLIKNLINERCKINRFQLITIILIINISILVMVNLFENYFCLNKFHLKYSETIQKSFLSFSVFAIIFAPLFEEILFRLPLKKNNYFLGPFLIGVIYILIFNIPLIKISLSIYLIFLFLFRFLKLNISSILTFFSIIVFSLSHIENYSLIELKIANNLEIVLIFLPQLIVGVIITIFRLKYSFKYGLLYHMLYNTSIILMYLVNT